MSGRSIEFNGRSVWLEESGGGRPLVWLHGFADVHGATAGLLPFHAALAAGRALIAPAHPGCADSTEDETLESIDDMVFHYLELFDALGLDEFDLAGACIGGWIAAEIAVRNRERVGRLALVGASGLFVRDRPIGDLFMMVQPENGASLRSLRNMLFAGDDAPAAMELFPDGRADNDTELRRYRMFRFAARIGFRPPYFYHPKLRHRLGRFDRPVLVVHGADDHMVPGDHAAAYAAGFPDARLEIMAGCGHSPHLEKPDAAAALVTAFLDG